MINTAKDKTCLPDRLTIRPLDESEIEAAHNLAWEVFLEFEAPDYPPEGVEEFRQTLKNEEYLANLRYYGAFVADELAGILTIRETANHICFFFVDRKYQRQGIGTKLFRYVLEDFAGQTITLNSAPYGLPFYKKLGFVETDSEQSMNGIRFTPMEYKQTA